ncbi:MAG: hypothetical protein M1836_007965 [Candelina mexicana]|nr:MAG: hypothetical protein M1836_007965 [Candelina mexicana]
MSTSQPSSSPAATNPNPTILLIPGAWTPPTTFYALTPLLNTLNYPTKTIALPSINTSPPLPDSSADVSAIRNALTTLLDEDKDVVLVLHSSSGVSGTEAAYGLGKSQREKENHDGKRGGGVVGLCYIAAQVVREGQCLREFFIENEMKAGHEYIMSNPDGTLGLKPNQAEKYFFNDLQPEEASYHASLAQSQSPGIFTSPLTNTPPSNTSIPSSYLLTKLDATMPPSVQAKIAREYNMEITEVDAAHFPWLSEKGRKGVVEFIVKAVGRGRGS